MHRNYLFTRCLLLRDDGPLCGDGRLAPAGQLFWRQQPGVGQHHRPDPHLPDGGLLLGRLLGRPLACLRTFFQILAWGAFTIGLIPVVARPVLRFAANAFDELQMGILLGSFVAVMILFIIPVTLLGTASPFAIRLAIQDTRQAGRISGYLYGVSTLGSFFGTFLPTLILIPLIGTYRTFLAISGSLLVVALFCLWKTCGWRNAAGLPVDAAGDRRAGHPWPARH